MPFCLDVQFTLRTGTSTHAAVEAMALPSQHLAAAEAPPCAIFCKGLAKGASERQIAALFQGFGTVVDCQVRCGRRFGLPTIPTPPPSLAHMPPQPMRLAGRPLAFSSS